MIKFRTILELLSQLRAGWVILLKSQQAEILTVSRFKTTKCRKFNSIVLTSRSHELRQKNMVSVGKSPKFIFSHNLSTLEHKTLIFDSFDGGGGVNQKNRHHQNKIIFLVTLYIYVKNNSKPSMAGLVRNCRFTHFCQSKVTFIKMISWTAGPNENQKEKLFPAT
uniref:Uncharacterized protein n=1 Tax=Micrurus paraensis TaxID=1970185 RepID=A0A2D4K7C8_9SAUR